MKALIFGAIFFAIALFSSCQDDELEPDGQLIIVYNEATYILPADTITIDLRMLPDTTFEVYIDNAIRVLSDDYDKIVAVIGMYDSRDSYVIPDDLDVHPNDSVRTSIYTYPDYAIIRTSDAFNTETDTVLINKTLAGIHESHNYTKAFDELLQERSKSYLTDMSFAERLDFFSRKTICETQSLRFDLIDVGRLEEPFIGNRRMLLTLNRNVSAK